jgi:hypothetical protein
MLKENTPKICVFVINTGAEILAKVVDETDDHWIIEKPLQLVGIDKASGKMQFGHCFVTLSVAKGIPIRKDGVITFGPPIKEVEAAYESTISEIIVPQKSSIIV